MVELTGITDKLQLSSSLSQQSEVQKGSKNITPRLIIFNTHRITENRNTNLLSAEEQQVYREGFRNWHSLVSGSQDKIERMILSGGRTVSCLIGIQPVLGLEEGEAPFLNECFTRMGKEINDNFCFLRKNGGSILLVNIRGAELILRNYQMQLELSLTGTLSRDEIISKLVNLITDPDQKKANLAAGLLSGYPLKDCQDFINHEDIEKIEVTPWQSAKLVDNPDLEFPKKSIADLNWERYGIDVNRNLNINIIEYEGGRIGIQGLGIFWFVDGLSTDTVEYIQKLWQVDRQLGLIDAVNKESRSFSYAKNYWRIRLVKQINNLLGKRKQKD